MAETVEPANSILKMALGLMFRGSIPASYAMIFDLRREQYAGIHMLFVRFPIDLAYLDKDRQIVDLRHLRAWIGIAYPKRPARYAIEMPAGTIERAGLKRGDRLDW